MIDIKNRRMMMFSGDRAIGVKGDAESSKKVFCLDRIQNGVDISDFVAFIKINPTGSGGQAYDQLLKKEIAGEKIILTWTLTARNLESYGEIEVQITMASPGYFNPDDLDALSEDALVLPAKIEGVSAPVWQSFKETFMVEESIEPTVGYTELSKNVLVSALADAESYAQKAQAAYDGTAERSEQLSQKLSEANELCNTMKQLESSCEFYYNEVIEDEKSAKAQAELSKQYAEASQKASEDSQSMFTQTQAEGYRLLGECEKNCTESARNSIAARDHALESEIFSVDSKEAADRAAVCEQNVKNAEANLLRTNNYRKIFSKTVTEGEEYICFEVTEDENAKPLCLSDVVIYMYVPAEENSSSYVRVEGYSEDFKTYSILAQFIGMNKQNPVYSRVECNNLGRWATKITKGNAWYDNAENSNVMGAVSSQIRGIDGKPLAAFRISQRTNVSPFPVGTHVEAWVRDYLKEAE